MTATLGTSRSLEVPEVPEGTLHLEPPPEIEPHEGASGVLMMALPMLGSVGAIVFVAAGGGGQAGPARYIASGMFLVAMLGFVFVQLDRQRKQRADKVGGGRREYLRYLGTVRTKVRAAADQQRRSLTWRFPEPDSLASIAEDGTRLWERDSDDEEFMQVRYGVAPQELALQLVAPESAPIDQLDPVSASALHRLIAVHRVQPDLPAALRLGAFSRIEVTGDAAHARALARALVCSATAAHTPDDLLVAVLGSSEALQEWDWAKWLPHAHSPEQHDALGRSRMLGDSLEELFDLLPADLRDRPRFTGTGAGDTTPHLLLVVDGQQLPPGGALLPEEGLEGVTVLELPARWAELEDPTRLRLHLEPARLPNGRVPLTAVRLREASARAAGDQMSYAAAEAFARRLAPLEAQDGPAREDPTKATPELLDLLNLGDVHDLDLTKAWRPRPERDRLRVPIGVGDTGQPVHLDIKESAQQGMGPHGLVIGATGSGKSEFLRTLVLGLLATHSSETLNMVLVDFKGGATFAGLADAPHISAVITNLEGELTLVDRMQDALSGEMVRRQELLRASGNYASLRDYEKARLDGADLAPMPSLFICVDEFSEMLSAKPDFIELFVAIGRLGRSLGIHLLLASQRLEEGRLRGLESHLSYRVGLRTFSGQESRAVIGVPDAYELPPVPGLGYLKPDQSTLIRFKASYVSGPPPKRSRRGRKAASGQTTILPFTAAHVLPPTSTEETEAAPVEVPQEKADGRSIIDIAVDTFEGQGPEAHQVWLPPLDVPDTFDELMADLVETPEHGLHSPARRTRGGLVVPLGTVDRPREQRRDVLEADLTGSGGHVAVVGGPRSGKSTLLRTLVTGVALGSTPQESQFYVLDFGGGTFAPLADLPHVAGVATRSEPDVVRRTFAEVSGIVDKREKYFRSQGIDSIETYRQRRLDGTADDGYGDVFLVVDGWSTLRSDFDDLEVGLQVLAQRGLTFGLHIITSASRWSDFRAAIRDLFGNRLELRLGDPVDSEIDRKVAALVPDGRPGRGIVSRWGSKLHFLGALPRVDGQADPRTVGAGVEDLVERARKAWQGPVGPKLRLLPDRIDLDTVLEQAEKRQGLGDGRLYLAVDERDLAPVGLDVDSEPHLLVFGDSRSGKSAMLRSYLHEVMRTRTPEQAQIFVVDYRRSLLGEVPDEYQVGYLTNAPQVEEQLGGFAQWLTKRLPGNDVTPQQLRDRSWWTGAEAFVVVDDYDLVATSGSSPLAPLVPLLGQARDVGLHLVVARRAGGASRALYDPVIQSLRELAMPGVLLSGDPQEGALIGNAKPRKAVAGRGQLITRDRGTDIVQLAWREPEL